MKKLENYLKATPTKKGVPTKIGFNIEVKYPNTEEAEADGLNNAEINLFCDRILDAVFSFAKERNIYFSSFHPEICLLMCKKQVCISWFIIVSFIQKTLY